MKVALVYDRVNKWGGAERVLLHLHKIFPDAPLFTSVYNKQTAPWADVFTIYSSFLQHVPFAKTHHELFALLMPVSFESFRFDAYDVVISLTSEAAKGIITKPGTKHICICLTPTRYLWSGYKDYFNNPISHFIASPIVWYLRLWDTIAAQRPDKIIAISNEVKERIQRYYQRESEVVYPGLDLSICEKQRNEVPQDPYFLVVSRLSKFTSYKRVDLAIKAANYLGWNLKIVGQGDIAPFQSLAGPTVEFVGKVSDEELSGLYANAQALIFPGVEDFGLVMIEAQSFGTPVIAFRGGGAIEIVKEGKTGEFFDKQTVASLTMVLEKFSKKRYNSSDCINNVKKFSFVSFQKMLLKQLESI